ncbi:MAG: radical SAM protein [Candidatus Nezhaarchaeales archaeon]
MPELYYCTVDVEACINCLACSYVIICPSPKSCVGCLACYHGCPGMARRLMVDRGLRRAVNIVVNGVTHRVPERITVKKALELLGYTFSIYPEKGCLQAPCGTGGCYACSLLVDGELKRACITPIREGMSIETEVPVDVEPLRIVHGPQPHPVGGKATPWWLKSRGRYIEVAIWTAGCNLRCPQCQNWETTYDGRTPPLTPREAALMVSEARRRYNVDRMAVSGGEPTLNRRWLINYFKQLKKLNPDEKARLHLDSNGTLLSKDYVDELVNEGGVTDIGLEPKAVRVETFKRITGIADTDLAQRLLNTSWEAVKYVVDNYAGRVFLGVGLPYNPAFVSMEEVYMFGVKLASINPEVQLCVLDYFPAFRRRDITRPSPLEMLKVKRVLEGTGLKFVVVQTAIGHIGPERRAT